MEDTAVLRLVTFEGQVNANGQNYGPQAFVDNDGGTDPRPDARLTQPRSQRTAGIVKTVHPGSLSGA